MSTHTPKGYRIENFTKYWKAGSESLETTATGCEVELWAIRESLLAALRAYMFMEQSAGGRNPHPEGTNKYRAFELGRAALRSAERQGDLTGAKK